MQGQGITQGIKKEIEFETLHRAPRLKPCEGFRNVIDRVPFLSMYLSDARMIFGTQYSHHGNKSSDIDDNAIARWVSEDFHAIW
jgi:hypothetical protein